MDYMAWSLSLLVLASVAGVLYSLWWLGADLLRPQGPSIAQRLADLQSATFHPADVHLLKHRPLSRWAWLDRQLREWPSIGQLDRQLQQTGWPVRVEHLLGALLATLLGVQLVSVVLGLSWPWRIGMTLLLWLGGLTWIQGQRARRRRLIETQLPDALDLIARAMQAGHALSGALQMAATEGPPPLAEQWQTLFNEINFGIPTRVAIEDFAQRVDSEYVRLFVVSTLIQMETGGNMAEILQNTARLIRQRQQLQASVKVLSAEGRISALILSTLPFALAGLLTLINPEFVAVLWTHPLGIQLLMIALGLMFTGIVWMWRMIDISV